MPSQSASRAMRLYVEFSGLTFQKSGKPKGGKTAKAE